MVDGLASGGGEPTVLVYTVAMLLSPILAAVLLACPQAPSSPQGEYAGPIASPEGDAVAHGVQLVDLGPGGHRCVLHTGGLPGDGWRRGDPRRSAELAADAAELVFVIDDLLLTVAQDRIEVARDGTTVGELRRTIRTSPTLGAAPPPGAVVLFDVETNGFEPGRRTESGTLAAGATSERSFGDHRVHLEFRTPFEPADRGQGRGNSGVYLQGRYECQVLDSFGLDGRANECGGIYGVRAPDVNACLPPGQWQAYDVVFRAARFDGDVKLADARLTVHLNGILVHDDVAVPGGTAAGQPEAPGPGPLYLQDHGDAVEYRNVWVVPEDRARARRVLFWPGRRSHGFASHEHLAGSRLLADALNQSGLDVTAEVLEGWPEDPAVLERADALVIYSDGGNGHPALRHLEGLGAAMDRGLGLVCLHYAVEVPKGIPGERFVDWIGGYFETHWSVNPWWTAEFESFPEHPITRGVRPFSIRDEWYYHMRFRPRMESVTPVLSAIPPASTLERPDGPHSNNPHVRAAAGTPQHLAWARVRPDGGRGFGFTGGHVHWNWGHPDFRRLVLNGIVWTAGGEVPDGGVVDIPPTVDGLVNGQDEQPPPNFDRDALAETLRAWRSGT